MTLVAFRTLIPARDSALGQFVRFGIIGAIGFVADSVALLWVALPVLRHAFPGHDDLLYLRLGRVFSYLVAATVTWTLNRQFTFKPTPEHPFRQWVRFLGANALGGAANYGTYYLLITLMPTVRDNPVLGVAAGAIAGLAFNFIVNKFWVFRSTSA
jgi:putative flippase GtrA